MDIFDRLGSFIEGLLDDDQSRPNDHRSGKDNDFAAAWDELDEYLRGGSEDEQPRPSFEQAYPRGVPASLRRDFRNLEVPMGTPFSEVKKAHKKLMTAFHPDRHSSDPQKQAVATRVTQKLNESYARIRAYYEGGAA